MIKRLRNKKNNSNNNELPEIQAGKTYNILDNRIETIRNPLIDLRSISSEYRGKVTFLKRNIEENEKQILQDICPTEAFSNEKKSVLQVDHGKCILCGRCEEMIPSFIRIDSLFKRPVVEKIQLNQSSSESEENSERSNVKDMEEIKTINVKHFEETGRGIQMQIHSLFGRSLSIRTVNAGSCNGCEIEINALLNPIYDIERYGINFVSSPRHADILLVTGPITSNMEKSLKLTYEAIPNPKAVIAAGACGCSGGIFADSYSVAGGADKIIPVDVYVPGCPPRPQALLEGIHLAIDKLAAKIQG